MKIDELWSTISTMYALNERKGNVFWGENLLRSNIPEEIELAFLVQNSHPNDEAILKRLAESYASELGRWMNLKRDRSQINVFGIDLPDNSCRFRQTIITNGVMDIE